MEKTKNSDNRQNRLDFVNSQCQRAVFFSQFKDKSPNFTPSPEFLQNSIIAFLEIIPILLVLLVFCTTAVAGGGVNCAVAGNAIEVARNIRNLRLLKKVPCKVQSRSQVKAFLNSAVAERDVKERILHDGRIYQLLGFTPKDYDYSEGVIKLYMSQLGGYYDPQKEYYAMADWIPQFMQMQIAVHELTHALQDQHYHLEKLTNPKGRSSDQLLARAALIEGDATAVMIDYSNTIMNLPPLAKEDNVSAIMMQNLTGAMLSTSFHEAPRALQASLIFPYVSGLNFVHSLLKKGGYREVDRAFSRLPSSTEEILHPDKYESGGRDYEIPASQALPSDIDSDSATEVFSDTLGEFLISTLLSTWLNPREASAAASGWGGDLLQIYDVKDSDLGFVLWTTRWDSQEDAQEFYQVLVKAYEIRFKGAGKVTGSRTSFSNPVIGPASIIHDGRLVKVRVGV